MLTSKCSMMLWYPLCTPHAGCWCPWSISFCCAGLPCPSVPAGYTTWFSLCQHCALPGVLFVPKATLDSATEQWGVKVARVEIKDIRIPMAMQRAMAAEAEAARETKAKVRPMTVSTSSFSFPCHRTTEFLRWTRPLRSPSPTLKPHTITSTTKPCP